MLKILIEMTEEDFEKVKFGNASVTSMRRAIQKGAPLSKRKLFFKHAAEAAQLRKAIADVMDACDKNIDQIALEWREYRAPGEAKSGFILAKQLLREALVKIDGGKTR